MRKNYAGSRFGALVHGLADANLAASQWLAAVIVVGMAIAIPSRCSAQSLNLSPDSSYGIFVNNGGILAMTNSVVNGGVDGNGLILSNTPITTAGVVPTALPNGNAGTSKIGSNSATFSATAASNGTVSTFNLNNFNLGTGKSLATMTLKGAAGDTFIFNVNGSFSLTDVTMKLIGIEASHVVFVISNNTLLNSIAISDSIVDGTFYNGSLLGSINLSGDNLTGAVVAGNTGIVTISDTTINASPFAAGPTVAGAPETPTIMTAGLAAFLIMGSSGISYLRRKRAFRNTLIAQ
jgi:hypothetical protein